MIPEDRMEEIIFRKVGGINLRMLVMRPDGELPRYPAAIFIHGGGFSGGTAEMLLPQCRWLVKLGIVCFLIDYRLMKLEDDNYGEESIILEECIYDCKAAVRYIRKNSNSLRIDPEMIVLFGESAGGYLASAVTVLKDIEERLCKNEVESCVPNLLVLYNPITHLLGQWKKSVRHAMTNGELSNTVEEVDRWYAINEHARLLSPFFHLDFRHPPVLVIHGLYDMIVPPEDSFEYVRYLLKQGVDAMLELVPSKHAFALFNYTASEQELAKTLELTEGFLRCQGYI